MLIEAARKRGYRRASPAEQAGVRNVLDAGQGAPEGAGVVPAFAHGSLDGGGPHGGPRRVVVVNMPADGVDIEAPLPGEGTPKPVQQLKIPSRHTHIYRGEDPAGRLRPPGQRIVLPLRLCRHGVRRPCQWDPSCIQSERDTAQRGQASRQLVERSGHRPYGISLRGFSNHHPAGDLGGVRGHHLVGLASYGQAEAPLVAHNRSNRGTHLFIVSASGPQGVPARAWSCARSTRSSPLAIVWGVNTCSFDRAAGFYDATRGLPDDVREALADTLAPELKDRGICLEIGVGTGRIALPLHQRGVRLVGADVAPAMLERLVDNAGGRRPFPLLLADATHLPVQDGTVGAVVASHVLHLVANWQRALDEAFRVLGGHGALFVDFGGGVPAPWSSPAEQVLDRLGVSTVRPGTSLSRRRRQLPRPPRPCASSRPGGHDRPADARPGPRRLGAAVARLDLAVLGRKDA